MAICPYVENSEKLQGENKLYGGTNQKDLIVWCQTHLNETFHKLSVPEHISVTADYSYRHFSPVAFRKMVEANHQKQQNAKFEYTNFFQELTFNYSFQWSAGDW